MNDVKLYHGDCLDILRTIPDKSVDLILTDPPYEMKNHGGGGTDLASRQLVKNTHIDFMCNGFDYETILSEFLRITKVPNCLIFCFNNQVSTIMSFFQNRNIPTTLLVWYKTNPIPLCNGKYISDCEFIVYAHGKGAKFNNELPITSKHKVYIGPVVESSDRLHPAQKPINLLKQYIELHSSEGDTVLDCFLGSGTTGVAAVETNRNFIGIEIDKEYYDLAESRILQAQKYPSTVFKKPMASTNKKLF